MMPYTYAMYSSESECDCEECNPGYCSYQQVLQPPTMPFYQSIAQPFVYYAKVEQNNSRRTNKRRRSRDVKKNPNCFVKCFNWYTQDRASRDECSERADISGFAEWLDVKYEEYLLHGLPVTQTSTITAQVMRPTPDQCNECKSDPRKRCSRFRSPWSRRRNTTSPAKNGGDICTMSSHSFEYILHPKSISRPASECCIPNVTCHHKSNDTVVISGRKMHIQSSIGGRVENETKAEPVRLKSNGKMKDSLPEKNKSKTVNRGGVECQCPEGEPFVNQRDVEFQCPGAKAIVNQGEYRTPNNQPSCCLSKGSRMSVATVKPGRMNSDAKIKERSEKKKPNKVNQKDAYCPCSSQPRLSTISVNSVRVKSDVNINEDLPELKKPKKLNQEDAGSQCPCQSRLSVVSVTARVKTDFKIKERQSEKIKPVDKNVNQGDAGCQCRVDQNFKCCINESRTSIVSVKQTVKEKDISRPSIKKSAHSYVNDMKEKRISKSTNRSHEIGCQCSNVTVKEEIPKPKESMCPCYFKCCPCEPRLEKCFCDFENTNVERVMQTSDHSIHLDGKALDYPLFMKIICADRN